MAACVATRLENWEQAAALFAEGSCERQCVIAVCGRWVDDKALLTDSNRRTTGDNAAQVGARGDEHVALCGGCGGTGVSPVDRNNVARDSRLRVVPRVVQSVDSCPAVNAGKQHVELVSTGVVPQVSVGVLGMDDECGRKAGDAVGKAQPSCNRVLVVDITWVQGHREGRVFNVPAVVQRRRWDHNRLCHAAVQP